MGLGDDIREIQGVHLDVAENLPTGAVYYKPLIVDRRQEFQGLVCQKWIFSQKKRVDIGHALKYQLILVVL